ncbi:sugar transferase [Microbacterium sp. NEAU-LLC]|uniref:Sugar transferase n=1 Tax=Microbacterium helvum TaxID=2773713 RepID=A0ABR8NQW9_9MICO|nr:sugar transferase [Microbacterium helvum]MBD3942554.1 sugar transferase [Microbacterium helvum]
MTETSRSPRDADWPRRYASRLFYSDALVVAATLTIYGLIALDQLSQPVAWPSGPTIPYWVFLILLGVVWLLSLDVIDTRDRHMIGQGITEYRRIVNATVIVFALVIIFAFFFRIEIARSIFIIALPIGVAALVLSRWLWRQWLRRRQRQGSYVYRAVVVGERSKIAHIARQIERAHDSGYVLIGALTRGGDGSVAQLPVLGDFADAGTAVERAGADTLIVTGSDELDPQTMRRLGWEMADRDINWVVAPTVTDVAGPRIHSRPVAGLPLVHIDFPTLEGYKRVSKRAFDLVGSTLLLVLLSPLMLVTAIAIRIDGSGPVFYRQIRVGRGGREFGMLKFRSMVANADDQLASLLDVQGTTNRPLFKVTNDPRITRVGYFIRKHSIDELPQLVNVFLGEMSLVGPRPQRAAEVALYDDDAHRRMLVKPGMSGLWQVSGRSKLSWEDSIRLDLYYVENWSFTQDIQILFRTIKAVIAPGETAH